MGEDHAYAVFACRWQGKAQHLAFPDKKVMGNLHQNTGPVAAFLVRAFCAAMIQVFQNLQGIVDNAVGFFPFNIHNKPDTAGVMFKRRVI